MDFLIVLVVLVVVVFVVTAPLRRDRAPADPAAMERSSGLAELEADRDAKFREIRDAELDHETGKLSDSDFEALDRTLRAEAVEIMHAIDRVRGVPAGSESSAEGESRPETEPGPNSGVESGAELESHVEPHADSE